MAVQEFKSTVTLKEGLFVEAQARNFKVNMDEPEHLGGTDKAMTPVEMLLASLGGCLSITIAAFSKAFHIDIQDCKVNVSGDLDPDGFMGTNKEARMGFTEIRYNVELVTDAPEDKVKKLMEMVEERCPVSDTLKGVKVVQGEVNIKKEALT